MKDDRWGVILEPKPRTSRKMFMDIPSAAAEAGFSMRHFRRVIETEKISLIKIGRKFFLVTHDFDKWMERRVKKDERHEDWIRFKLP